MSVLVGDQRSIFSQKNSTMYTVFHDVSEVSRQDVAIWHLFMKSP